MKSIIVTGASGNLGKSVVSTLHQEGYHVLATFGSNRELGVFEHLPNVKSDIVNVLEESTVHQYLTDNASCSITAAVLLVGGFAKGTIEETDVATLDKMYQLNFMSAFNFVKPLLAQFEQQGGGQFIFIGARSPLEMAESKEVFAYTMSKALVFKLADYVNAYGKEKNIKATILVPITIDTPQTRQTASPNTDFSKWVTPDFIAQKIAHLVSDTEGGDREERILKLYN
jgi:NAD(P)-dependent dehydrogenase (short-subunit alcohol dehydrogenase family)